MGRLFTILWTVSLFGRYSVSGLTALSIIYPIQLLIIALAVGTGVGVKVGRGKKERSRRVRRRRHAACRRAVAFVCSRQLADHARLRPDVDRIGSCRSGCNPLWKDCLRFQRRLLSGKHLVEGAAGEWRYENAHAGTDYGRGHQYCAGSAAHLRSNGAS